MSSRRSAVRVAYYWEGDRSKSMSFYAVTRDFCESGHHFRVRGEIILCLDTDAAHRDCLVKLECWPPVGDPAQIIGAATEVAGALGIKPENMEGVGPQEEELTTVQKWQTAADAMDALGRAMKEAFGIVEGTCPYTFCGFHGYFTPNFAHPRAPWLVCPKCGRGFCLEYLEP